MGKKSKTAIKEEPVEALDDSQVEIKQETEKVSYDELLNNVSIIAKPMASRKLTRRIYKLIKKAAPHKEFIRNGLKDVQRRIRLGEKGLVFFAGDVTPIDIMCHMPAVCEEKDIPYVYTPSRLQLGGAMGLKRSCLMILVKEHPDYKSSFDEIAAELKAMPPQH